jgi:hypothetical protein
MSASLNKIHNCIPPEAAEDLTLPLSTEDITKALKQSPNGKAPGLNGIPTKNCMRDGKKEKTTTKAYT